MVNSVEKKIDVLTRIVTDGFAAAAQRFSTIEERLSTIEQRMLSIETTMHNGFAALAEDIADVKHELSLRPTRPEVEAIVDSKLAPLAVELHAIRRDLTELRQRADNNAGLTKEIDHGLTRIAAIERHLGLAQQIAA